MFLCIKSYVMNDETIAFKKTKIYKSEIDNCITNEKSNTKHFMDNENDFFEHFKLLNK